MFCCQDIDENRLHITDKGDFLDELVAFEKLVLTAPSEYTPLSGLKKRLASPKAIIAVIKDRKGFIKGYAIGSVRNNKIPSGHIYKIAVSQDIRRKGIATRLVKELESFFMKNSVKRVFLEVRESNTASLSLFKKNGYVEKSRLFAYYECLGEAIDLETGVKLYKKLF